MGLGRRNIVLVAASILFLGSLFVLLDRTLADEDELVERVAESHLN